MFSDSSPEVDSPWKTEFPPVASSAHAHMRSAHKIEVSCADEQHALVGGFSPQVILCPILHTQVSPTPCWHPPLSSSQIEQ